jgi:hypothetical protein
MQRRDNISASHRSHRRRRGRRRALAVILLIGMFSATLLGSVLGYIIINLRR